MTVIQAKYDVKNYGKKPNQPKLSQKQICKQIDFLIVLLNDKKSRFMWTVPIIGPITKQESIKQ